MLNGADNLTDKRESRKNTDVHKSASVYTADNCLFATFPKELQNAIGKRQVKYDSVYNKKTEANLKTTNDKLWLFSPNELTDTISAQFQNHPLECNINGMPYKKFEGTGDGCKGNTVREPFYVKSSNGDSIGDTGMAWLRSSYGEVDYCAVILYKDIVNYSRACNGRGVSVGFTLKR